MVPNVAPEEVEEEKKEPGIEITLTEQTANNPDPVAKKPKLSEVAEKLSADQKKTLMEHI